MIITTTPSVEGRRITSYGGIVFGEVISGVNFARDIAASFTNFFGGRSRSYEEELTTAREQAIDEMAQRAARMGADAVVGMRYASSSVMQGAAEVVAYGTAVKFR